jgi:hypothetical protein
VGAAGHRARADYAGRLALLALATTLEAQAQPLALISIGLTLGGVRPGISSAGS